MAENPGQNAAEVRFAGVTKTFNTGLTAISKLDLDIRAGEFLTLLGPSGSGKTTALNLLAGFQAPTTGQILVDGNDISGLPPHKRNIGVVFQHYALFPHMTVRENVSYPLKQRRVGKAEMARQVDDALRMVSLQAYGDRLPRQLSGGQQQRVAVARAIVFRPRLLLMDEPLGALDRKLREAVQLELKRIHRDLGATIVFVTHDQDEALVMSDRIAIFDAGKIQQIGTAEELYDRPATQFVAQFLGESNIFTGSLRRHGDTCSIDSPDGVIRSGTVADTLAGDDAAIVVRPERCRLFERGKAPDDWNSVDAWVSDIVYLGALRKVLLTLASGETAVVICQPDVEIPAGPEVTLGFPVSAARTVTAQWD